MGCVMDGFFGDVNAALVLRFGQSDACCGVPGRVAPAPGLGAGSAVGTAWSVSVEALWGGAEMLLRHLPG